MSRIPKKYAIDDIRGRFQTVAIDNKYQAFIEPNEVVYNAATKVGITRRFIDEDLGLYTIDAVLPGSSFADIEVVGDRQGITERMPYSRIYDDVTFTFLVDRKYNVLKFFESWLKTVNPLFGESSGEADNNISALNYPKDYKCKMSIVKYNKDYFNEPIVTPMSQTGSPVPIKKPILCYTFLKAWPLSVASIPVNYEGGSTLKVNVTFRYNRYKMSEVTEATIRKGWKGFSDSFDPWMGEFVNAPSPYSTNTQDQPTTT